MPERKKDEDFTNIRIHKNTHAELNSIGKRGESMDDIVRRCLEAYKGTPIDKIEEPTIKVKLTEVNLAKRIDQELMNIIREKKLGTIKEYHPFISELEQRLRLRKKSAESKNLNEITSSRG